jgi:hypothetical protein
VRGLEPDHRRIHPCGLIASAQGVAHCREIKAMVSLWLGGMSFICSQLVFNSRKDKCYGLFMIMLNLMMFMLFIDCCYVYMNMSISSVTLND